jgi:hypothetical protein
MKETIKEYHKQRKACPREHRAISGRIARHSSLLQAMLPWEIYLAMTRT